MSNIPDPNATQPTKPVDPVGVLRGLAGAVVGGVAGYFLFEWIYSQGYYAMLLPGTLVGLGCGILSGEKSYLLGFIAAVLGLCLGIYCEWAIVFDPTRTPIHEFLPKIPDVMEPVELGMVAGGGALAFWFGVGRKR